MTSFAMDGGVQRAYWCTIATVLCGGEEGEGWPRTDFIRLVPDLVSLHTWGPARLGCPCVPELASHFSVL